MFILEKTAQLDAATRFSISLPDSTSHLPIESPGGLVLLWSTSV